MTRTVALVAFLLAAAPASAVDLAPRDCGKSPTRNHYIHVDAHSTCGFGLATWRALRDYSEDGPGFIPAVEKDFKLRVAHKGRKVRLDCRAIVRAHGEFDFYCNNLNRWRGSRVVRFDNATLP